VARVKEECSKARLLAIAEAQGLATRGGRMQCPARCSDDARGATVDDSDHGALWSCKRCGKGGSVIDFFQVLEGLDVQDAIAVAEEALGIIPEPPPSARAQERRDPLKTWQATTDNDPPGLAYLRGRGLDSAVALGAVRFNTGRASDSWVDAQASAGYRVAMPLRDRHGTIVSVQLRSVNKAADPTKLSLAKCPYQCSVGLGDPVRAAKAETVFLSEGMADTLALTVAGVPVVGAPGADQLHRLVDLVGDPRDRRFILCPQNDKLALDKKTGQPKVWKLPDGTESTGCQSRLFFDYLGGILRERGGEVLVMETPAPSKDPAEWLAAVGVDRFTATVKALAQPTVRGERPPAPVRALRAVPNDPSDAGATSGNAAVAVEDAPKGLSKSYASLCHILRTAALRELILGPGDLEFNAQALLPTIGRKPLDEDVASSIVRERCETRLRTNRAASGIQFNKGDIDQALIAVAREKTYNPVADYLRGLKWDGVHRLDHICDDLFECEKTEITALLMRRWMISAVARALRPGCKVDTVLILVGAGGRKKSTFFEELVGEGWFSDSSITIGDKDAYLLLRRVWVLEWAELEAMQKAARAGAVKAFIASRSDYFRPPYARSMRAIPRTSVIVGTTNENEPLSDPTGNRRYWPIRITGEIYLDGVRAQRDQLWAEAVAAFDAGERWWLEADEDAVLDRTRQAYEQRDPWEDLITEIVHEKSGITTNWILEQLHVDMKDRNRGHQMRVAAVMGSARLGYVKRKPVVDGRRAWVWVKDQPEQRNLGGMT
jgi:hypothetical protein